MLRSLVLLFALLNVAIYFWLQSTPRALQPDREPQRLTRQVAPDAIQVLPDLPVAASDARAAAGAAAVASAASGVAPAASGASGAAGSLARPAAAADLACSDSGPLDDAQLTTLKALLAKAGVPADAITERRQAQGGSWIIYLGRFADGPSGQQKAAELRKLDVKFERVTTPAALAPGLSLGRFTSAADADQRLAELTRRGVHGARVVAMTPPTVVRHLQVRATNPGWRLSVGTQRFDTCPDESATTP